jgi:monofunctional glycosyltransferase
MAKSKAKKSTRVSIRKVFIVLFFSSLGYLLVCKWVFPPITLTQLFSIVKGDGLKREYVSWSQISPAVKLAAIASEDQLFARHSGFDWSALRKSINQSSSVHRKKKSRPLGAAASTISQQTAKNIFLWQGSGWGRYVRKMPEFFYTQIIEWFWGKQRILEVYLNTIEMGRGIYGIEAAAQAYFHKSAKKINREEAAMIIACLPNPKKFSVVPRSRRVSWRYPQILKQMTNLEGDPMIQDLIK